MSFRHTLVKDLNLGENTSYGHNVTVAFTSFIVATECMTKATRKTWLGRHGQQVRKLRGMDGVTQFTFPLLFSPGPPPLIIPPTFRVGRTQSKNSQTFPEACFHGDSEFCQYDNQE